MDKSTMALDEMPRTERLKLVLEGACKLAKDLGDNMASTEHLLLAMLNMENCVGNCVLDLMEINRAEVRDKLSAQLTRGSDKVSDHNLFTGRAKFVFSLAEDESKGLGMNFLGTEHLLLGLIREKEGLAGRILMRLGVDLVKAREAVKALHDAEITKEEAE